MGKKTSELASLASGSAVATDEVEIARSSAGASFRMALSALSTYIQSLFITTGTYTAIVTPTTSGSVTLKSGSDTLQYTKTAKQMHVHGLLEVQSVSSPAGIISINLPLASAPGTESSSASPATVLISGATAGFTGAPVGVVQPNTSALLVYEFTAGSVSIAAAKLQANTQIYVSVVYDTAS